MKMTVSENELAPVPVNGQGKKVTIEVHTEMNGSDTPAYELRLLGMRYEEALKALERQLDLASMKGLKEFTIVHGKGYGILQEMVQSILKTYAAVSEYHFARPEDGGPGKTIVKLS
jgi:DNA mismatch repair protein MutS2